MTDLTPAQLEHVAQVVVLGNLRNDLKRMADLSRINVDEELKTFLSTASPTDSWRTIEIYAYGLSILERWVERRGLWMLDLTPKQADDYIDHLRAEGRAPATIRIVVAAAGAFFSFLERRFDAVRNPFRGTRARPAFRPVRDLVVPTREELQILLGAASRDLRAALVFMSGRGFRVGALPTLVINQARFVGRSKGKDIAERLTDRVLRLTGRLFCQGLVRHAFSAHDLRHYFAVATYGTDPDLYRLKVLLGHSSVATTERYLRSLAVEFSPTKNPPDGGFQ